MVQNLSFFIVFGPIVLRIHSDRVLVIICLIFSLALCWFFVHISRLYDRQPKMQCKNLVFAIFYAITCLFVCLFFLDTGQNMQNLCSQMIFHATFALVKVLTQMWLGMKKNCVKNYLFSKFDSNWFSSERKSRMEIINCKSLSMQNFSFTSVKFMLCFFLWGIS